MRKILVFVFMVFCLTVGKAQHAFSGGMLPKLNFSAKVSEKIKLVQSIESRQQFYDNDSEMGLDYQYVLTDFAFRISRKVFSNQSLNIGYTLRLRQGKVYHRITQQYNIVRHFDFFRMGHRLATDQTYSKSKDTEFRFRYRLTFEIPLSGDKVDPGEFYAKMGNEYLLETSGGENDLEIRLLPFLGYEINKKNKVETGLDYRVSDISGEGSDHALRLSLTWYKGF